MSAVAALWCFDGAMAANERVGVMARALAMHGPDGQSLGGDREVALAWRSRVVLPEDRYDRQPCSGASAAMVVADCRIDNRLELRDRLELHGDVETLPDSAYVLAAYDRWGEDCCQHLIGDYAFVIWDAGRRRLFAARDAIGARPLYFHRGRGFIALASMPKGLFALPEVSRRLNRAKLVDTALLLRETGTDTLYEEVERVPPGHALVVGERGHQLLRYWQPYTSQTLELGSDEEYQEAFEVRLEEAVRCRLRAVSGPVAVPLSGGFDSASVATLAAEQLAPARRTVLAVTAATREGFSGRVPPRRFFDEERYAALVAARHANVEHVVMRKGVGLVDDVEAFHAAAEVPLFNLSNQTWISGLMRVARSAGAKVLLSARQGNMTISHRGTAWIGELARKGRWLTLGRELGAIARKPGGSWTYGLKLALLPNVPTSLLRIRGHVRQQPLFPHSAINRRCHSDEEIAERVKVCAWDPLLGPPGDSRAQRVAVIYRFDEAAFHAGYEAMYGIQWSDPTADRRLVELCLAIPEEQYFRDGEDRRLLRRMMATRLPEELLCETRKGTQSADWYEYLQADLARVSDILQRCARSTAVSELLDVPSLRADLEAFAKMDVSRGVSTVRYRQRLLRGVALGSFVEQIESGRGFDPQGAASTDGDAR